MPRSPSPVPADTAAAADVAAAITSTTSTAPESSFHDDKPNGSSVATNAVQASAAAMQETKKSNAIQHDAHAASAQAMSVDTVSHVDKAPPPAANMAPMDVSYLYIDTFYILCAKSLRIDGERCAYMYGGGDLQVSADEPLSVADTKQDAAVCSSDATLVHTNTVSTGRVSPIASTTSSSAAAAVTSTSSAQSSIPTALSSIPTTQSSISTAMSSSLSGTAVASGAPGVSGDLTNSTVSSTLTMPVHSVAITTQSPQGVVRGASVMGEGEPSHATQCTDGTIQQGENVAVASVEAAVAVRTHPQL